MVQADDSILQVCQLTELKQTKEWERYPTRFRRLNETLLPENLLKALSRTASRQNRVRDQASHSRKQQTASLLVYTDGSVTKDQSGWGFTVKQGLTAIHENSAVYTILTSSFTMELEAVTHTLRWIASRGDCQITHTIILTACYKKCKVEWEAQTGMCRWSTSTFETSCGCTALHAGVKGNDRADRLAGKAILTSGLLLGRSEVLTSLRHCL